MSRAALTTSGAEPQTRPRTALGVDGCRAGWFWISLSDADASFGVASDFVDLLRMSERDTPILVDIPIGLPAGAEYPRECDALARRTLGQPRGSSVFNVPGREALETTDINEARGVSRRLSSVAFSNQLWEIRPKILEVDRVLRADPVARTRVRETHPELAFWALNDEEPVTEPKRSREGFERRLSIMSRFDARAEQLVEDAQAEFLRTRVQRDDIVDAFVCALVARSPALRTVPADPPRDEFGLPMEMCVPAELPVPIEGDAPRETVSDVGSPGPVLSHRFERALTLARRWHSNQTRKGSRIPYIAHLMSVAALVTEAEGDEDQAIAALFHDALEDAPDLPEYVVRRHRIAAAFGPDVLAMVEACTDGDPVEKREMTWHRRKDRYLSHLEEADVRALVVSAADKLHNARWILYDVRRSGLAVFERFNASREDTVSYYGRLAATLVAKLPEGTAAGRMARELERVVTEIGRVSKSALKETAN